jgi:hypothetical protein
MLTFLNLEVSIIVRTFANRNLSAGGTPTNKKNKLRVTDKEDSSTVASESVCPHFFKVYGKRTKSIYCKRQERRTLFLH